MGVVYEAVDRETETLVALKVLRAVDAKALFRFKNEFRALQDIHHPNLVRLGELIEEEGIWFFSMELVRGQDFLAHVRPSLGPPTQSIGPADDTMRYDGSADEAAHGAAELNEGRLRATLAQLSSGLAVLHRAGKVHRDIKPSNIIVTPEQRVVLLDFGLVTDSSEVRQSTEAHVVGTAAYMAPEQAASEAVGAAADWYSVGVLIYQALTGRLPFAGTAFKIFIDKQTNMPAAPRTLSPNVPADLDELCMSLLQVEPEKRPAEREILERFGVEEDESAPSQEVPPPYTMTHAVPFVGRDDELATLEEAFSDVLSHDQQVTVFVHGESGVGKTELVRYFTEGLTAERADAVLLHGRCYERETVPFKALDGIVDELSRYLRRLPTLDAATLVPRGATLLPRVFPVLGRVEAISAGGRMRRRTVADPRELRRRAFAAMRELLVLLGERHPLILVIDDFQWSDADSMQLLGDLFRPPDAPRLLLVISSRAPIPTADEQNDEPVISGEIRTIELDTLDPNTAEGLAEALLNRAGKDRVASAAIIASEAEGHPLYINELVRYAAIEDATDRVRPRLEDAIWARVEQLEASGRKILELVCVAAVPIPRHVVADAARIDAGELARQASVLRVSHLARSGGGRETDLLEPYHNRVRDAVTARLDARSRLDRHQRLAVALESAGMASERPQLLVRHLEAAGQIAKAAELAEESARRAARALAFDRAAELYRTALRLDEACGERGHDLHMALGEALASGGRCVEAAQAYLQAAVDADPASRLECQRRAAQQFLISGHIDRGLDTLREVLQDVGVSVAPTPRRALASLIWQRVKLRLRGMRRKARHESQVAPETLKRLDVFGTVASGLATVDTIRGAAFQTRWLRLALQTGEPSRLAVALLQEANFASAQGGRGLKRAESLIQEARRVSAGLEDDHVTGWILASEGFASYFRGRYRVASQQLTESARIFREHTIGSSWELNNVRVFRLLALRFIGDFAQLQLLFERYTRDASQRGDRFMETTLRRAFAILELVRGDPDSARDQLQRARWTPPGDAFHVQHWYELEARSEIALYEGAAPRALEELAPDYERLGRSLLLRLQIVRVASRWIRARTLLSAAVTEERDRKRRLAEAARLARRMARESVGFPRAWSRLVMAAVMTQQGKSEHAYRHLREAIEVADAFDMEAVAASARHRLGELVAGNESDTLIASSNDWMSREKIAEPARLLDLIAPGFTLSRGSEQ